jgi:urease accessory protein
VTAGVESDDGLAGGDGGAGLMLARVLQLASPALPIGAYSYSSGLESALDSGLVHDDQSAFEWIADALALVHGRYEAPVVAAAAAVAAKSRPAQRQAATSAASPSDGAGDLSLDRLDDWVRAGRESAELRLESEQMGYSLRQWLDHVPGSAGAGATPAGDKGTAAADDGTAAGHDATRAGDDVTAAGPACANAAVVFGIAAARLGLSPETAAMAWLWGFAENQVMVLIKAMPIGQIRAQRLLWRLGAVVAATAAAAARRPQQQWSNAAPGLAIASMRHERQYSRLFRS